MMVNVETSRPFVVEKVKFATELVGKTIVGWYPAANYRGVKLRYEERVFRVDKVRDTKRDPIEQATVDLDPLLLRGQFLLTGFDLERNAERSFWLASFTNYSVVEGNLKRWIEGFSQVVAIDPDGFEEVIEPCIPKEFADKYVATFNRLRGRRSSSAVARQLVLPSLARNLRR